MIYHFGDAETVKNLSASPMQCGSVISDFKLKIERFFTGTVDGKSGTFAMYLEDKNNPLRSHIV